VRDDESGVFVDQFADVFDTLALTINAAFGADSAEGGGITTTF
jgi:hypothetical protein